MDFGVAFRFESWTLEDKFFTNYVYGSYYPFQDTKTRLFLNVKQKIPGRNNFSINLSNYFTRFNIRSNSINGPKDYRLKRDHFIDFTNSFKSKKNRPHFVLGVGTGLMNCGTKFTYIRNTNVVDSNAKATQRFLAPRLIIGAQNDGLNASLIFHGTPDQQGEQYPTIWMEIRLGFTINPFSKKKKS